MLDTSSTQYFIAGWTIILGTIWIMSKFEGTKTLLYYLFWLGVVLDLVTHGQQISTWLMIFFPQAVPPPSDRNYPSGSGPASNTPAGGGSIQQNPGGSPGTIQQNPTGSSNSIIQTLLY